MTTPITFTLEHYEVIQALQTEDNAVPLVPGKRTLIRCFLEPAVNVSVTPGTLVRGKLHRADGEPPIESRGTFELPTKACTGAHKEESRRELRFSLNFELPDDLNGQNVCLTLGELSAVGRDKMFNVDGPQIEFRHIKLEPDPKNPKDARALISDVKIDDSRENSSAACFVGKRKDFTFRVHTIGLRYKHLDEDIYFIPSRVNFDYLKSFLRRAFPISALEWNETVIDADPSFGPPFTYSESESIQRDWKKKINALHMQLMAIRVKNLDANMENHACQARQTHFYGMVFDPEYVFDGEASDVPRPGSPSSRPRPEIVAVGQAETYSGYYGAHELAHTLGQLHPGFPVDEQEREDDDERIPSEGLISNGCHVGLDFGDEVNNMQILPRGKWHDIMSYEDNLWVSSYTHRGLWENIFVENYPQESETGATWIHIIGEYDATVGSERGKLRYVLPVNRSTMCCDSSEEGKIVLRRHYTNGDTKQEQPEEGPGVAIAPIERTQKSSELLRSFTAFQTAIPVPDDKELSALSLHIGGKEVDRYVIERFASPPELDGLCSNSDVPPVRLVRSAVDLDASEFFLTVNVKKPTGSKTPNAKYTIQVRPLTELADAHLEFVRGLVDSRTEVSEHAEADDEVTSYLEGYLEKNSAYRKDNQRQATIWHTVAVDIPEPRNVYLDKQLLLVRKSLFELDTNLFDFNSEPKLKDDAALDPTAASETAQPLLAFQLRVLVRVGLQETPLGGDYFEDKVFYEKLGKNPKRRKEGNLAEPLPPKVVNYEGTDENTFVLRMLKKCKEEDDGPDTTPQHFVM